MHWSIDECLSSWQMSLIHSLLSLWVMISNHSYNFFAFLVTACLYLLLRIVPKVLSRLKSPLCFPVDSKNSLNMGKEWFLYGMCVVMTLYNGPHSKIREAMWILDTICGMNRRAHTHTRTHTNTSHVVSSQAAEYAHIQ